MRDPYARLVKALIDRSGGAAQLVRGGSRPWASVTFVGSTMALTFALPAAAAEAWLDGLSEAEFGLRRHFVADIALIERRDQDGTSLLTIEALVLEEG